jgi:glycerophosphoryl diester phosphodiesterase
MELRRGERGVLRIGHRGAAALARENSLAAIEAAAAHDAHAVELDLLRAADGSLVLAHGPGVPPDAPPLDDALALVARLGLAVQLDVKVRGVETEAVAALGRHGLLDRCFVSSSSLPVLAAFARQAPCLPRAFTYPEDRLGLSGRRPLQPAVTAGLAALRALLPRRLPGWLRTAEARAATLSWTVVSPQAIRACHAAGAAVYVWTVDDAALARTLAEMGADGIISDDPGILLSW